MEVRVGPTAARTFVGGFVGPVRSSTRPTEPSPAPPVSGTRMVTEYITKVLLVRLGWNGVLSARVGDVGAPNEVPVAPVGPVAPVAPVDPVGPVGPVAPVA